MLMMVFKVIVCAFYGVMGIGLVLAMIAMI